MNYCLPLYSTKHDVARQGHVQLMLLRWTWGHINDIMNSIFVGTSAKRV